MKPEEKDYLLGLVKDDLKAWERVLPDYIEFSKENNKYADSWAKKVNETNDNIALCRKTIETLSKL